MEDKPEPSRSTSGGRPDAQSEVASDLTPSEEEGGGGSIGWYGLIFAGRAGSGIRCSANGLRQAGGTEDCRSFCQFGSIGWSATAACTFSAYGVIALLLPCVLPYHCRQLPRLAAPCRTLPSLGRVQPSSCRFSVIAKPKPIQAARSRSRQRRRSRTFAPARKRSQMVSAHLCTRGAVSGTSVPRGEAGPVAPTYPNRSSCPAVRRRSEGGRGTTRLGRGVGMTGRPTPGLP